MVIYMLYIERLYAVCMLHVTTRGRQQGRTRECTGIGNDRRPIYLLRLTLPRFPWGGGLISGKRNPFPFPYPTLLTLLTLLTLPYLPLPFPGGALISGKRNPFLGGPQIPCEKDL